MVYGCFGEKVECLKMCDRIWGHPEVLWICSKVQCIVVLVACSEILMCTAYTISIHNVP